MASVFSRFYLKAAGNSAHVATCCRRSPRAHTQSDFPGEAAGCYFSLQQFSSVAQSCPTLCDPMDRSTPGLPVHHQLPEFTQTHVHWVSDAIQPSHPLSSPSPPALNLSQHQGLVKWVTPTWDLLIDTNLTLISLLQSPHLRRRPEVPWSCCWLLLPGRQEGRGGQAVIKEAGSGIGCWLRSLGSVTWQLVMWMTTNSVSSSASAPVKCWLEWRPP